VIEVGGMRDKIRAVRAAEAARHQYAHEATRLAVLARDHRQLGHELLAREAAFWSRIAERAALAEVVDPAPR
jgi:hypothetical protein